MKRHSGGGIQYSGKKKLVLFLAASFFLFLINSSFARDAAFVDPGAMGGAGEEAVKVDPKPEVDVGETALNVAKRASIFFVNQTNVPVKIEKVVVNGDSNVTAEASANDCTKQGSIAPLSRCSVEISATPTSPGAWSVDVLMTHNGAGRLTRARVIGKTTGTASGEKSTGLAVNSKETKPIDFGAVDVGSGKIVRSTLMVNDSGEPITIYAIDVIEADNGLQRLEQGCAVDMELAPGASCPVTLLWVPKNNGPISTDLIIRHSGKLGFAVIPVRGTAKGGDNPGGIETDDAKAMSGASKKDVIPLPPSAKDLEKEMAGKISPVSDESLGGRNHGGSGGDGELHLIGTVGDRALLLLPSGETAVVGTGGAFDINGKSGKVIVVGAHSVDVSVDGKKRTLTLQAVSSLVSQAAAEQDKMNAASSSSSSRGSSAENKK